jgi:hypothetical protein
MESLPIITKTYEVYKATIATNQTLTKRWRHSLGISIEESMLQLLERLIMAKNAPRSLKASYLIQASAQLEVVTLKIRLLLELELVNATKVFQVQAVLQEIGRMLGGWLKSCHTQ